MKVIKPHAALYAGTWFRSRLEACWAAYFEHFDIAWEYEARELEFDDGTRYQPDFWLPDSRAWFEVKGTLTEADLGKLRRMTAVADPRGDLVILAGSPAGMVFGELSPYLEWNPRADIVRCRKCRKWTISMLLCRACGYYFDAETDVGRSVGTFEQSITSGPAAPYYWPWDGTAPVARKVDVQAIAWAEESTSRLANGGITALWPRDPFQGE